jgi:hypothetical protein
VKRNLLQKLGGAEQPRRTSFPDLQLGRGSERKRGDFGYFTFPQPALTAARRLEPVGLLALPRDVQELLPYCLVDQIVGYAPDACRLFL